MSRRAPPRLPVHAQEKSSTTRSRSSNLRGKRTGTVIKAVKPPGEEDPMEEHFDTEEEKTPQPKSVKTKKKRREPKTPKTVKLFLPPQSSTEEDSSEDDINSEVAAKLTNSYVAKLKQHQSPSELSAVSTAPPTPHDEEPEEPRFARDDELHTQEEEVVVPQASSTSPNEKPLVESPDPNFPPMGLDDDQDNDDQVDLGPPAQEDFEDNMDFGGPHNDDDEEEDDQVKPLDSEEAEEEPDDDKKPKATSPRDNDDDDFDDDDEGPGFNMVHDPETPAALRKQRAEKENAVIEKERRRRKKQREDSDSDTSQDEEHTPVRKPTKKKKKRHVVFSPQGIPVANRTYKTMPVDHFVQGSPEDEEEGTRRSRRARVKPLAYWKNEKFEYGPNGESGVLGEAMGDMPVVVNVVQALPTPYKKLSGKKVERKNKAAGRKPSKAARDDSPEPFDNRKMKKRYKVIEGEGADLWDDVAEDVVNLKVVSYAATMESSALPISKDRTKEDGKVASLAAQAFNIPNDDNDNYAGYIMGNLTLPPKGIKDAESVGPCSQTFTVVSGQPNALEVAYGDPDLPEGTLDPESAQRFFLQPGDLFRVPPGNCYRLQNHSKSHECILTWTIIRPRTLLQS